MSLGRAGGASRIIAVTVLGALLVGLEVVLRGEDDLRTQIIGQSIAAAIFLPAVALAWRGLGLGRLGLVIVLVVAGLVRAAAFVPTDATPPLSTDIHRYAWDGRVQLAGINPYRYAPNDPALEELRDDSVWPGINRPTWRTVYPPGAEAAYVASQATFGDTLRSTTWLFLIGEAIAIALLIAVLRRLRAPPERIIAYAWHPLAISEIAGNGHVDALAILAIAVLLAAWCAGRRGLAGLAAGFGTLVKFGPLLLLPALMRRGGRMFVAAAVLLIVAGYIPYALTVGSGVFGSLSQFEDSERFNGSLDPLLQTFLSADAAQTILAVGLLAVIAVVALRRHDSVEQVARSGLLVLGGLLIAVDYVQPWHALWLTPFMVLTVAPAWMYLTLALPVGYVAGITYPPPLWVAWIEYIPFALLAVWGLVRHLRRRSAAPRPFAGPARTAAIIPVLEEEDALRGLLAEWPIGVVDEILVVDGGSTDRTVAVAAAAGARVVAEPRRGYGRACAAGAGATDADILVFLDGDGSCDPAEIPAVLAPVRDGTTTLSVGRRRRRESGAMEWHQRLGNRLVALAVRLAYGAPVHDIPPLRAIRRDTLASLELREMTYGWPTEMIVTAARGGHRIVEIDVACRARRGGESKVAGKLGPSLRAGARMLTVALRDA